MDKQQRFHLRSWHLLPVLVGLVAAIPILGSGGVAAAHEQPMGEVGSVSAGSPANPGPDQPDACGPGSNYIITQSSGNFVSGQTDIGNHCDDCTTLIGLPFPVILYKQVFTTANVSSNGNVQYVSNNSTYINTCLPNTGFISTIFPHWGDLRTDIGAGCASYATGCGIFTLVQGASPNRRFIIEWRTHDLRTGGPDNFEVILYEGLDRFDMTYAAVTGNGNTDTVGVEKDAGSGLFTQYSCNTPSLFPGLYLIARPGPCDNITPTATMTPTATATATATPPLCGPRSNYLINQSGGGPLGGTLLVAGSQGDDVIAPIALPFPFNLYGVPYNNVSASSNGNLQFTTANTTFTNTCLPDASMGESILAHWDDLRTDQPGGGVYTSLTGPVGSRIFTIQWRAVYFNNTAQRADFEVRLHENTGPAGESFFDIFFTVLDQGASSATIGVQSAAAGLSTQYSCNTPSVTQGMLLAFSQRPCATVTPTLTVTPTPTCVPGEPILVDVRIMDLNFLPPNVVINQGSTVRWTNLDSLVHTTTSTAAVWDSGPLAPGQQFSFTFNIPGAYPYHCAIHTNMTGTITVIGTCPTNTPTATATPGCPATGCTPTPTPTATPGCPATGCTPTSTPTCPTTGCTPTPTPTCSATGCTPTPSITPTPGCPATGCTPTPTPTCVPGNICGTPTATPTLCNSPTGQCTPTPTPTQCNSPTGECTPTPTPTCPTGINCGTATPTPTQCTFTPCTTSTPTPTRTCTPVLIGHVVWQGIPQPDPRNVWPISFTLKLGALEANYPAQNTSTGGVFSVPLSGLPSGLYNWRAKGPKSLASSGQVAILQDVCVVNLEIGVLRAGDANNDNVVNVNDFNILKSTNGKSCGDVGYDTRADFNNDCVVNIQDFNLLKGNFGGSGAPPIRAVKPDK